MVLLDMTYSMTRTLGLFVLLTSIVSERIGLVSGDRVGTERRAIQAFRPNGRRAKIFCGESLLVNRGTVARLWLAISSFMPLPIAKGKNEVWFV